MKTYRFGSETHKLNAKFAATQKRQFSLQRIAEIISEHNIVIELSQFTTDDELGEGIPAWFVVIDKLEINTSGQAHYFNSELEAFYYAVDKLRDEGEL
ncbi:MAG: hypothetical protein GY804_03840 [Alphaproteobacteria bacterium]|nr:hypothetical protein [Alphaproteobacteria bacterium]